MFIMVRNYLAANFTTEDLRIQVRGLPANYVYGCQMTPVTRGALGYISYQKGIIQWQLVHRYASRRVPALCPRIVLRTVLSLDVSTQTVFQYDMSVKILWGVISDVFGVHVTFWFLCQTDEINTIFQPFVSYLYEGTWILVLLLIFVDWYEHSNSNVAGCKCILNWFWCVIWRPKAIFYQNVHIT